MFKSHETPATQLIRLPVVLAMTGLSRSQIYALIKQENFPRQVHMTPHSVAWVFTEIQQWISERMLSRDSSYQSHNTNL
jgi:prophage regulatory protein